MGRAARLKKERKLQLLGNAPNTGGNIVLQNPVQNNFVQWIFGNSLKCEAVAEENSAQGQHLVLCGAGPSLRETAPVYVPKGDQVWGCNSALTYLIDQGFTVTHGFTVDQTAEMLAEWATVPDVEYLIASTVHPHLTELLQGRGRRTRFFHNYVGVKERPVAIDGQLIGYEDWLYQSLFPTTIRTGSGLNSVNRALDLALFMGFATIDVLGADCALRFRTPPPAAVQGSPEHLKWMREEVELHADGGHGVASNSTALVLFGTIDDRQWLTKPDMVISATWLEKTRQRHWPYTKPAELMTEDERRAERAHGESVGLQGRIRLIGDTLPVALKDKPDEFLKRLPAITDHTGEPVEWM